MARRKFDIFATPHAEQARLKLRAAEILEGQINGKPAVFFGDDPPVPKRSNRGNVRVYDPRHGWFDSKTELACFLSLVSSGVDVIRQVRIPVARDEDGKPSCLVVDFLEILRVDADGTFTARLSDAKGFDRKRGSHRVERDWKAKAAALYDKHGIKILKRSE